MSADSLLTFCPSGGPTGIAATPCWPERQDSILMTKCAFGKSRPASGHGKDIQVEPLLHIEVEGAPGADVAPGCDSSARRVAGAASTLLWSRIMPASGVSRSLLPLSPLLLSQPASLNPLRPAAIPAKLPASK